MQLETLVDLKEWYLRIYKSIHRFGFPDYVEPPKRCLSPCSSDSEPLVQQPTPKRRGGADGACGMGPEANAGAGPGYSAGPGPSSGIKVPQPRQSKLDRLLQPPTLPEGVGAKPAQPKGLPRGVKLVPRSSVLDFAACLRAKARAAFWEDMSSVGSAFTVKTPTARIMMQSLLTQFVCAVEVTPLRPSCLQTLSVPGVGQCLKAGCRRPGCTGNQLLMEGDNQLRITMVHHKASGDGQRRHILRGV